MMASNATAVLENQFFYEDEVFAIDRKTNKIKFGLVLENFEAAVSESEDFDDILRKGEIRVTWHPDGSEEIISEKNVGLADRTLMPGDVVRRLIPGKDTQRGYCRDILVHADVKILGSKYVVRSVAADRLRPLNSMPRDNAVCFDSWVGSTKTVNEMLVLKSSCGAVLELRTDMEYWPLKDQNEWKSHGGVFLGAPFYPGQTLVGPVSALDSATWITMSHEMRVSRKHKTVDRKFVVQSVEIEGVWVQWQCKALSEAISGALAQDFDIQQPKCYITGEDLPKLKRLNLYESCMLQINDKNYLKLEPGDAIVKRSTWRKDKSNKYSLLANGLAVGGGPKVERLRVPPPPSSRRHRGATAQCDTECDSVETATVLKKCDKMFHSLLTPATLSTDDWMTDPSDASSRSDTATTHSSCSSPTPKSSPKRSPLLAKKIKKLKKRNTKPSSGLHPTDKVPAIGSEVITEALVVYSTATVVWQDGTIEAGIPSTQLYPIHHLDDHEFFPGDFVLAGGFTEGQDVSHRDYGVIQRVDHQGRTALVKWFRTYTCADEPRPQILREAEVSVYDLKDHPDFQYRPGTIVIRVANFQGEDSSCTAGQVIDNYPEGKVKVWWVDGHTSLCWPQDLFEVGQYDADNNFWGNGESDDSWETESEVSEPGGSMPKSISKPHLAENLERARVAMARLEEIFSIKPNLQNQDVMKKLLGVYKKCRYLDRLMGTTYFHEDNFMGLLERVRKGGNATTAERVQDQMNRLFHETSQTPRKGYENPNGIASSSFRIAVQPTPPRRKPSELTSPNALDRSKTSTPKSLSCESPTKQLNLSTSSDISSIHDETATTSSSKLLNVVMSSMDKATQNAGTSTESQSTDSGLSSTKNCDSSSSKSCPANNVHYDEQKNGSFCSIQLSEEVPEFVCAKLCALIKGQLVKALQEINHRFGESLSLSEIVVEEYDGNPPPFVVDDDEDDFGGETQQQHQPAAETSTVEEVENATGGAPVPLENFLVLDTAPNTHKFHLTMFQPKYPQQFFKAVRREHKLLKTALPPGVWVRLFEDRMDLLSVMIEGPMNTPYEDGMFLFDIQLGSDYPTTPPLCHYVSYCSDRLNPNLYEDGKVCVSLLGTWSGRGTEIWGPESTLLQVIVSIQGLILVSEPYFNEAGYDKQKGTQQGIENSRMYNEMVIIKLIQSTSKLLTSSPEIFRDQIVRHFKECGRSMYTRIHHWMDLSNKYNAENGCDEAAAVIQQPMVSNLVEPEFPLVPASRGFCLTLSGLLESFRKKLDSLEVEGQL